MKHILRSAVLSVAAATGLVLGLGGSAVAAPNAVAFVGTAHITCFGCGTSSGTASLTVAGTLSGSISASYTVNEPAATCPAQGTASGTYSGAGNGTFSWTRVGATAVILTTGTINGAGVAGFAVTSPVGSVPCGKAVTAEVAGVVAGT